ncbi:MAG: 2-amino-4-hydroxy-6-hydroxymethyldihydropteridine diphosphokinase [Candidatus Latescibacterota bacterium]|nr:MAG: 2-amino-4-hydroxy-6-hydroxymethyldihydropteridine diphosphokinase [Candidatus Latescibacterota bacterium]
MSDTRGPDLSTNRYGDAGSVPSGAAPKGATRVMSPAFVGVGANLGDKEASVLRAVRMLESSGIGRLIGVSSLYETEPVDCPPMASFVNAVAEIEPLLCPTDLLKRLQTIEKLSGRSGGHNEPREIDLDIITLGTAVIETPDLVVPHPRYRERTFVLIPLRELAPRFECPATGQTVDELLAAIAPCRGVSRISSRQTIYV